MGYLNEYQLFLDQNKILKDNVSELEYSVYGTGDKVILALLGNNLLGSQAYFKTITGFSNEYKVVSFLSNTSHKTLEDLAFDVSRLLETLKVEKAHILGISIGGALAQVFAQLYPEKTASIMLYQTFASTNVMDDEALATKQEILDVIAQLEELRKQVPLESIKMAQLYQIEEILKEEKMENAEEAVDLFKYLMVDYTETDEKSVMLLLKNFLEKTIIKAEDLEFLSNKILYIYDSEERALGGAAMDDALLDILPEAKAVSLDLDRFLIILNPEPLISIVKDFIKTIKN